MGVFTCTFMLVQRRGFLNCLTVAAKRQQRHQGTSLHINDTLKHSFVRSSVFSSQASLFVNKKNINIMHDDNF